MNNKLDINIFSNKGNFNLKLNPLCRPKGNYQPPAPPSNALLPRGALPPRGALLPRGALPPTPPFQPTGEPILLKML